MIKEKILRKINDKIYLTAKLEVFPKEKAFWIINDNDQVEFIDEEKVVTHIGEKLSVIIQSSDNRIDNVPTLSETLLRNYERKDDGYTTVVEAYVGTRPNSITKIIKLINKNKTREKPGRITENDPRYRTNYKKN